MHPIIPQPALITTSEGSFTLNAQTRIVSEEQATAHWLANALAQRTGLQLEFAPQAATNSIQLSLAENTTLGDEGYQLDISAEGIHLCARQPAGLFYAAQTLLQLLGTHPTPPSLPLVSITDSPRFSWRGAMLDVARHFFGVEDVKRFIDLIAHYKINRLHLHLTDDQGWRIEIKSWPRLTEIGGQTQVNGGGGGFYTQEQFKEIVAYAQRQHVMVIPEIDTPGHTNAALASYAELNVSEETPALYEGTEVGFSSLGIHMAVTYQFLDDVVRELAAISPAPYIHIGGDETHATPKEDFKLFIRKMQEIVLAHNKIPVGWAEIGEVELDPRTIAQHWQGAAYKGAKEQGNKFIISPGNKTYLDMKYDESTPIGLTWAGLISVKDAYDWDPATYMDGLTADDIIGLEAPLWTETVLTMKDIEFMVFPRLPGLAELAWSKQVHGWDEYKHRLAKHGKYMEDLGINFFRSPDVEWES